MSRHTPHVTPRLSRQRRVRRRAELISGYEAAIGSSKSSRSSTSPPERSLRLLLFSLELILEDSWHHGTLPQLFFVINFVINLLQSLLCIAQMCENEGRPMP